MFKEVDIKSTDSLTLKHIILANFGYLLANTIDKEILNKLNLNMQYLTSYLIESKLISSEELKQIVNEQNEFGLTKGYGVINMFKGDELIRPDILFQLSNITSNINNLFFKDAPRAYKFLKIDKWFRDTVYNKPIREIYTSFFNVHKQKNLNQNNSTEQIKVVQNLITAAIDNIDYSSDKHLMLYEEDDKDVMIQKLQCEKIAIIEDMSKYILIGNERLEKNDINGLDDIINFNLTNIAITELKNISFPLIYQKYPSLNVYYSVLKKNFEKKQSRE